jgi:hypothetical protein
MTFSHIAAYREPRQMYGVPGLIYILENSGLRPGFYKIGITRRSGWAKAVELNRDAQNSIPGSYECIFEHRAKNCGAALDNIVKEIHFCQRGKREQNFFEIDCNRLQQIILHSISRTDQQSKIREYQEQALRQYLDDEKLQSLPQSKDEQVRMGIFRKAYLWMTAATH